MNEAWAACCAPGRALGGRHRRADSGGLRRKQRSRLQEPKAARNERLQLSHEAMPPAGIEPAAGTTRARDPLGSSASDAQWTSAQMIQPRLVRAMSNDGRDKLALECTWGR
jgi:hypothetical protein